MLKKTTFLLLLFALTFTIFKWSSKHIIPLTKHTSNIPDSDLYHGSSYVSVHENEYDIALLNKELSSPTRVKITPDSKYLLVTQLTGEVFAFTKQGSQSFNSQPNLVTKIDTNFPGFPPEEAGLVSVAFSSNYTQNHRMFLLYSFKGNDGKIYNRISSTILSESKNRLYGSTPNQIFQANTPGTGSHQITDGLGFNSRLYLLIGDGFEAKLAQDPRFHAGKLMSITEEGSDPQIHVLGVRNAYVMEPFGEFELLIADTGPDHFDRLIKLPFPPGTEKYNFNWDGTESSLQKPISGALGDSDDLTILLLSDTRTLTGLVVDGFIIYTTAFGKTGFKDNNPGKELWKINFTPGPNSHWDYASIIHRHKDADGKFGNPIGLARDPQSGHLFFLDILEGRLYEVKQKGGE